MGCRRFARIVTATAMVLVTGCATPVFNHVSNVPVSPATPENMGAPTDFVRRNAIFLSLSGGGLRAAAFSYGVFTALEELKTDLERALRMPASSLEPNFRRCRAATQRVRSSMADP